MLLLLTMTAMTVAVAVATRAPRSWPVPESYMQCFGTREWSRQRDERYRRVCASLSADVATIGR